MHKPALFIGGRYASLRSSNQLVSFISLLTVIGMALGVGILLAVLSVMNGFDRELQQRILALVPHLTVTSPGNEPLMSEARWQPYRQAMENTPGVTGTAPYLQLQGMLLAGGQSKGILLNGIDPAQETQVSIIDEFIAGGSLDSLQPGSFAMLIGSGVAEQLDVGLGDSVTLISTVMPLTPLGVRPRQTTFTVSGIFSVGSQIDNNAALVHLRDAQTLYRLRDGIHGYRLQTEDLFGVFALARRLQAELPEGLIYNDWTYAYGNIYENIRMSKSLVGILLTLLVAVAAFNIVVSLIMVVRDKQGDIAILRAMGISLASIRRIFLVQGMLIGIIGTGFGLLLGVVLSLSVGSIYEALESLLGVQLLSADIYPVDYLPSQIRGGDLFLVCILSLSLSLLATLYPASRAAATRPAEILRHE